MPTSAEPNLPDPTEELYFAGMELHGNVLFARKFFGRKVALMYLKLHRRTTRLYMEDRAGFSVRETAGLMHPEKARAAAALRLALIDKLAEHIRTS